MESSWWWKNRREKERRLPTLKLTYNTYNFTIIWYSMLVIYPSLYFYNVSFLPTLKSNLVLMLRPHWFSLVGYSLCSKVLDDIRLNLHLSTSLSWQFNRWSSFLLISHVHLSLQEFFIRLIVFPADVTKNVTISNFCQYFYHAWYNYWRKDVHG